MNEKIKELSDIAYKNHLARNPNSSFGRRTDYDKEFAELIIKECAEMCHYQALLESENGSLQALHKERALDAIGKKITESFGIN